MQTFSGLLDGCLRRPWINPCLAISHARDDYPRIVALSRTAERSSHSMTPYVLVLLNELTDDLPKMQSSMGLQAFRDAVKCRCTEILELAPAIDREPATAAMNALRSHYGW